MYLFPHQDTDRTYFFAGETELRIQRALGQTTATKYYSSKRPGENLMGKKILVRRLQ